MRAQYGNPPERTRLHDQITRELAVRVIQAERGAEPVQFPNETDLCRQLGVSRTVLRESMKVLVDKGMVEMRPRAGTRARPRSAWHLLDPDILAWRAELHPDSGFLRDLCEVRLAIEPTACGFAAVRASRDEIAAIERTLKQREARAGSANFDDLIDLDLEFHNAVVAASHNPLLAQMSAVIREPFRTALLVTSRSPANVELALEAHREVFDALRCRDPLAARAAAERAVGLAMVAVEEVIRAEDKARRRLGRKR